MHKRIHVKKRQKTKGLSENPLTLRQLASLVYLFRVHGSRPFLDLEGFWIGPKFQLRGLGMASLSVLVLAACQNQGTLAQKKHSSKTVAEALGPSGNSNGSDENSAQDTKREYIASFATTDEAAAHRNEIESQGGSTEALDTQGRIIKATVEEGTLNSLTVSSSAKLFNDSTWSVGSSGFRQTASFHLEPDFAENLITTRSVTGVEELLKRFPEADGRGKTVAILDTGIEFSSAGISTFADGTQKLIGYYDLTDFGKVTLNKSQPTPLTTSLVIDEKTYTVSEHMFKALGAGSVQLLGTGMLSEAKLAEESRQPAGVDLNGNGKTDDAFAIALVEDAAKKMFVLIDSDLNNNFEAPDAELLTDFNSSYLSVDLRKAQEGSGEALAVSILSNTELQFHTILGGHGTSCATIVAGNHYLNGRVDGLAPRAKLLSFVLDATGRDVYKSSTLLKTFLTAKDQGADAISVSWGFATSDLNSAQQFADILDTEIASKGVVIGIAAGNAGPGSFSANSDDYIPRLGFGLGAAISEKQARNVYNWLGVNGDHVIHYSSVGPTLGGRAIPDLISPLMTLVRSERTGEPGQFIPFGGTSSATPAFIGSVAALLSVLDSQGLPRNMPVLKSALLSSARSLVDVPRARQGMGMVDVNKAYDLYVRALANIQSGDTAEYRLSAQVQYPGSSSASNGAARQATDGIVLRARAGNASELAANVPPVVNVNLVLQFPEDFRGRDAFVDQLKIEVDTAASTSSGAWLEAPDLVTVQTTGGKFPVRFKLDKLIQAGLYRSELRLVDSKGLIRLRVPVHVEIPFTADTRGYVAQWQGTLKPFEVKNIPFKLTEAGPLNLKAAALGAADFAGGTFVVTAYSDTGNKVLEKTLKLDGPIGTLDAQTDALPAGYYEFQVFQRTGTVPAEINVSFGAERLPFDVSVETIAAPVWADGSASGSGEVLINIHNLRSRNINRVKVKLLGQVQQLELVPTSMRLFSETGVGAESPSEFNPDIGFPAFRGVFQFSESDSGQNWQAALVQPALASETKPLRELAVAFTSFEKSRFKPFAWDWMPVVRLAQGTLFDGIYQAFQTPDGQSADSLLIEAYPNIGDWQTLKNERIYAMVRSEWKTPQESEQTREAKLGDDWLLSPITLPVALAPTAKVFYGELSFYQNDLKVGSLPLNVRLGE